MAHWSQLVRQNRFQKYDYGVLGNTVNYGSIFPPRYPLEQVYTRVALFSGSEDTLSDTIDMAKLTNVLPNIVHSEIFPQ
jgi:lysosomal acid lipase/cholesteryl ester hydrolase